MPLLSLPSELFFIILRFVGSREFQEDVGRLTICRKWYMFAQIIVLEELELNLEKLVRLKPRLQAQKGRATAEHPGAHCQRLSIYLENCHETPWNKDHPRRARRTPLNVALQQFAQDLSKGTNRLRTLNFETPRREARSPRGKYVRESPLFTASILDFLDMNLLQSLESLHLDLAYSFPNPMSSAYVDRAHYCLSIAALLPRLSHAKIRLPRICPDCFPAGRDISSQKKQENNATTSRLKTLAVCLSVCTGGSSYYATYAVCCQGLKNTSFSLNYAVCPPSWMPLLESVKSVARRSPHLKVARILANRPKAMSRRLVAWDCITGERFKMGEHDAWDAEIIHGDDDTKDIDIISADW